MPDLWLLIGIGTSVGAFVGAIVSALVSKIIQRGRKRDAQALADRIRQEAQTEVVTLKKETQSELREEMTLRRTELEREERAWREELGDKEKDLVRLDERLQERTSTLEQREAELKKGQEENQRHKENLEQKSKDLDVLVEREREQLVKISGLTTDEAKDLLLKSLEADVTRDAARVIKTITEEARERGMHEARKILTTSIQRCATDHVSDICVSTVALPNEEIKGRIIGREGRNIRSFEALTGVNIVIDDTPEAVVLSCFDPVRREVARVMLEHLVNDGRIHPGRIEELFEKVTKEVEESVWKAGEDVCFEVGVVDLHPELIKLLGRMKYRYSYGQNMIPHLKEVTQICMGLGEELGANIEVCRRGALLHDIGKAVSYEREGSHAIVGAELCKKYGEKDEVVHCVAAHHEDVPLETVESVLVQVSDAISAARPGARREVLDTYVKRLEQLEHIADSFSGVERAFAIQAGREIRILVKPDDVDDQESVKLAYDISQKIESEMEYPGQIKITVVRETRAQAFAR